MPCMMLDAKTCEACEAETQARLIARGKRSATPGIHHPPPSCVRRGRELHHPPCNFGGIHSGGVCNRAAVVRCWDGGVSPHSRLRRQCGVIEVATAPRLSSTTAKVDGCWAYAIRPSSFAHGRALLWRPTMQIYAHYWLMQDKWLIINLICRHAADGALAGGD